MTSHLSRRDFLTAAGATLTAGAAVLRAQPPKRLFAYVASWTSGPGIGVGNGGGISVFSVDMTTGALTPVMRTGQEFDRMNTGYLAVHPSGRFLYATNEVESYDNEYGGGAVLTFAISPSDGSIAHVGTQQSRGFNVEPSGRFLFAGNQGTGNVVTFTVDSETGKLMPTGAKAEVPRPVCVQFASI
jgi:6-phosphogluconolactonase